MKPNAIATTLNDSEQNQVQKWLIRLFVILVGFTVAFISASAFGQETKLQTETIKTKDNIKLRTFYFPSNKGKEAIPVLIVHEWKGQASPYAKLVLALNKAGCAVIVPDYRGHGGSKEYMNRKGETKKFNIDTMNKNDIGSVVTQDLEAVKRFLVKENNEGKLNLNALVVIGIGEGCILGSNWAMRDWQFGPVGSKKRGQDVKALVYVSPKKVYKGVSMDPPLKNPAILSLPTFIIWGSESDEAADARQMSKRITAYKKRAAGSKTAEGIQSGTIRTSLSGPSLVNESKSVIPEITKFIQAHIDISDEENPWVKRE